MTKPKLHSPNLTEANIEKIAELFPSCVVEAKNDQGELTRKIDFDQLRQELSESIVEGSQERYRLDWPGKREALLAANSPIAKTLRPCRNESVDFDTTQNLFIEGDNLEALKLLQETYLGKVKMIYIDPPYNTGKDFIYDDDFSESSDDFLVRSNQKTESGSKLVANTESNGRFHSDWLTMIYSRLRLAKNLLTNNGVIFISIDNGESSNLRKISDDVFGEQNFVEQAVIKRSANGLGSKEGLLTNHDYILVYQKSLEKSTFRGLRPDQNYIDKFEKSDDHGLYKIDGLFRKKGQGARRSDSPNCFYPVYANLKTGVVELEKSDDCQHEVFPKLPNGEDGRWIWSKTFATDKKYRLHAGPSGTIYVKDYWRNDLRRKPKSIFEKSEYLTDKATNELTDLFGFKAFSTPKPISLIKDLIEMSSNDNDIILDFFAGSATTAHAAMQLNSEDKSNRRFIMIQEKEECDNASDSYKTIADISKERIRRAGKKIKGENATTAANLDIGFRVLKIDTSNAKDIYYTPDAINQEELALQVDHIKEDRTAEDLLFQVMLDWGVDLALPISKESIQEKDVYFVDENAIAACFETKINEAFVKELAKHEPLRVVFRDTCFESDSAKINVAEIFKLLSPNTDIKTI